jgi:hypothetical protein
MIDTVERRDPLFINTASFRKVPDEISARKGGSLTGRPTGYFVVFSALKDKVSE